MPGMPSSLFFHLNHVGYKVSFGVPRAFASGCFHLNHVGYKDQRMQAALRGTVAFI